MSTPYCIISISDERSNNINNIKSVFGYEPDQIKFFDIEVSEDIVMFKNLYPNFDLNEYLSNKKYVTNPSRTFGEIGCWMSHYNAWVHMLNNNYDDFFIVEDDCFITDSKLSSITDQINLEKYDIFLAGQWAEFYYLNKTTAKFLVDNVMELGYKRTPVDEYMFDLVREYGFKGRFWGNIVSQINFSSGSQINQKGMRTI